MLEQNNELEQIEVSIDQAKDAIKKRDRLKRLIKNRDFKELIDDGYFEGEAVRLVHLKSDANVQDEEQQAYIVKGIDAIGFFRSYLRTIFQQGNAAETALAAHEATREEILSEANEVH